MMQSNDTWSRHTEVLETAPLLSSECSNMRYGRDSLLYCPQQEVCHHSPNSSISSRPESNPSCSRPPAHRRRFSAGSLLLSSDMSHKTILNEHDETSSLSPDSPYKCSEPRSPRLLSRYEHFYSMRKWVELRLENSGSVARDHLASERTFLAYMRTSLAIVSAGVGESYCVFESC